ncbi:MAG: (2Fe-2S)-binding protein [Acidimicrobiales bacterium]
MVVCHCHGVNDSRIRDEVADGAGDLDELSNRCGAGSTCGGCRPTVERLLEQLDLAGDPTAA